MKRTCSAFKRGDAQDLYAVTDEGALRAAVEHVELRMKNTALPPLNSPAAYLRDALKKQYASEGEGGKPPSDIAAPRSRIDGRLQRLREEWQHHKSKTGRCHRQAAA